MMNEKELSEIRRRWRPNKNSISHIRGCYVNERREILSIFNQSVAFMTEEETDMYLSLMKRCLSGGFGKNLIDINFATSQVGNSEEHNLLMSLRNSDLKDDTVLQTFYQRVIENLKFEGNYVILIAYDAYDVPYRGRDGERFDDASSDVFSYFLCSICPVKKTKPALSYDVPENAFHNHSGNWIVSTPELGFMFPAFDDRSSNIYNALYYSRDTAESHTDLVDALFHTEIPLPAAVQKETFQSILSDTLADDCNFDVLQSVHEQLSTMIETHKINKEIEPLALSKGDVKNVLESCGVSEAHLKSFAEKYDESFGGDLTISPKNIVDTRQFEVRTPDVVIRVNPERSDLIETRVINGCKYILINADAGVEVNGINILVPEAETAAVPVQIPEE